MIHLKSKFLFAVLFIFACCLSDVRFEEPQPEALPNEQKIPKKLQGKYVSEEDSSQLSITSRFIIRTIDKLNLYSKAEFDSLDEHLPRRDTLLRVGNFKYEISKSSDSTFLVHAFFSDTLFSLSPTQVLRRFRGFIFISRQDQNGTWVVQKIDLKRKGLIIGSIRSKEEMLNLRTITAEKDDSTFVFHPSQKEFRRFVKNKNFGSEEKFWRIN